MPGGRLQEIVIDLADATAEYPLPSRFRHPAGAAWLLGTSGERRLPVGYLPRRLFLDYVQDEDVTGSANPSVYTIQNRIDTGNVTVYMRPNTTTLVNYPRIMVPYYSSIGMPSGSEIIRVGENLGRALFAEAKAHFYEYQLQPDAAIRRQMLRAQDAWHDAETDDNMRRVQSPIFGSVGRW